MLSFHDMKSIKTEHPSSEGEESPASPSGTRIGIKLELYISNRDRFSDHLIIILDHRHFSTPAPPALPVFLYFLISAPRFLLSLNLTTTPSRIFRVAKNGTDHAGAVETILVSRPHSQSRHRPDSCLGIMYFGRQCEHDHPSPLPC